MTASREKFDLIADGMEQVVESGTARASKVDSLTICGKTGTIQNPHGDAHSAFIGVCTERESKDCYCRLY